MFHYYNRSSFICVITTREQKTVKNLKESQKTRIIDNKLILWWRWLIFKWFQFQYAESRNDDAAEMINMIITIVSFHPFRYFIRWGVRTPNETHGQFKGNFSLGPATLDTLSWLHNPDTFRQKDESKLDCITQLPLNISTRG